MGETNTADVPELRAEVCRTMLEAAELITRLIWQASDCGHSRDDLHAIRLACEEAFRNAFVHGNASDLGKCVRASWKVDDLEFLVVIEDEGSGFDPKSVPDPTSPEGLSKQSGRGLLLMRRYMDVVEFLGRGNVVRMSRIRSREKGEP